VIKTVPEEVYKSGAQVLETPLKDETQVAKVISHQNSMDFETKKALVTFSSNFPLRFWSSNQTRNIREPSESKIAEYCDSIKQKGWDPTLGKMIFVLMEKLAYKRKQCILSR